MTNPSLLFINYEFPPLGGGGGHASRQIASRLVNAGWKITVITSRYRGLPSREDVDDITIIRIPTLRRRKDKSSILEMAVFLLMSLIYAPLIYRRLRPRFVVSFFSIPSGPAALLLKLLFGVPFAVALRGADVPGFLPEQLAFFHRVTGWLTRLIWQRASFITANSNGLKKIAESFFPGKEIRVVPNGVSEEFYRERDTTPRRSNLKTLSVGRLSLQKRVERQIEAMAMLVTMGRRDIHLTIVGDGPERRRLETLATQRGLATDTVTFLGWIDREELQRFYRTADVFLMTSDYEGMPNTVLEAMAASLAVVATASPGTEDLVHDGDNGFTVPANNPRALAEALCRLADTPELLRGMQRRSYAAAKRYTWDDAAGAYGQMIGDALSRTASSGDARNAA